MQAEPQRRSTLKFAQLEDGLPRSHSVLLLVDFINMLRFPGSEDLAPAALRAATAAHQLKQKLRARGVPVVYANDNYGQWRSEFSQLLKDCKRLPGEAGRIARLMAPAPEDLAILKPRHSAFLGTPLELLLAQMHVRRIVLAGLSTDICVQLTAMDAHLRGYQLWVPRDCSAAESPEAHENSLAYMARVMKAKVGPGVPG